MNPNIIKPVIACIATLIAGCYLWFRPDNALAKALSHGDLTPRKTSHLLAFGLWGLTLALAVTVIGAITKKGWLVFVVLAIMIITFLCVDNYEKPESQ